VHDRSRAARAFTFDGFGPMRKRLVAWTILTSVLIAAAVWTVLGPPEHACSPRPCVASRRRYVSPPRSRSLRGVDATDAVSASIDFIWNLARRHPCRYPP
jgi:hypothetical protein